MLANAIDTSHCRYNPYLVACTYIAVLADETFERAVLLWDVKMSIDGVVLVCQCTGEVGLEVVLVDPLSGLEVFLGMTDGIAVFYNVLTFRRVFDKHFVSGWGVLHHFNVFAVYVDSLAFFERTEADNDRVGRIDFNKRRLFHFVCL